MSRVSLLSYVGQQGPCGKLKHVTPVGFLGTCPAGVIAALGHSAALTPAGRVGSAVAQANSRQNKIEIFICERKKNLLIFFPVWNIFSTLFLQCLVDQTPKKYPITLKQFLS